MLDLARDTASDVQLGTHGDTGLANLALMLGEAGIDCSARCAHLAAEHVGQFVEHLEVLLAAHAVATGHDDVGALDVHLALLNLTVDDFHHEAGRVDILVGVQVDDLALVVGVKNFLLHHTLTHGSHLGTALGVDDGGDDVAAEGGTDLVQQVLVLLALGCVGVVTDLQRGAVGGQAAVQARGNAGTQVTADGGGAHEAHLRLNFLEQGGNHAAVGQ